jgi:hypothetical protein
VTITHFFFFFFFVFVFSGPVPKMAYTRHVAVDITARFGGVYLGVYFLDLQFPSCAWLVYFPVVQLQTYCSLSLLTLTFFFTIMLGLLLIEDNSPLQYVNEQFWQVLSTQSLPGMPLPAATSSPTQSRKSPAQKKISRFF